MSFQVSDKVVCVYAGKLAGAHPNTGPRLIKGAVYCVEKVWFGHNTVGDGALVRLAGEVPEFNAFGKELGWDAFRFRLVSDVKQENCLKREASAPTETHARAL